MQGRSFERAEHLLEAIAHTEPDVLITDVRMPGMSGIALLERLRADCPGLPIIVITAHSDLENAVAAYKGGAFEYLPKPFDLDEVIAITERALAQASEQHGGQSEPGELPQTEIIGEAPAMQEVFRAIGRLAHSNITVLINGESGTGKELVARAIHNRSNRKGAFVPVNCGAIPADLLESELFGHEKGAFTGAISARQGRFELAEKGTLFLDEIGDMSLPMQVKLLRVLDGVGYTPLGGIKLKKSNFRVIAATNRDLVKLVKDGRMREDFFYRIRILPVQLPPLRERKEDIPYLVDHFLAQFADDTGGLVKGVAPAALDKLKGYHWPGNVRELKNAVERLLIMVEGDEIRPEHVVGVLRRPTDDASALGAAASLRDFKEAAERSFLVGKLRESGWNISATAQAIGTPRSNLYKKLQAYGIEREEP